MLSYFIGIRKMQIEDTRKYHFIPARLAKGIATRIILPRQDLHLPCTKAAVPLGNTEQEVQGSSLCNVKKMCQQAI